MKKNSVSLSNVISKRILAAEGWRKMTENEQTEAIGEIKEVLLRTCRSGSQTARAIQRLSPSNLPEDVGIYRRVTTRGYVAGQDYPSELKYIKQRLVREI